MSGDSRFSVFANSGFLCLDVCDLSALANRNEHNRLPESLTAVPVIEAICGLVRPVKFVGAIGSRDGLGRQVEVPEECFAFRDLPEHVAAG